ncbi:ATP-dependent sacrificial sulfur transferase LarE [Lentzea sp. NPDC058450]|uniref:ATP-dependent sacrificial sulfur transferase LarE n=1 Tax=Lentzea sp. NPDC058450 TaxID=3346505 RepID=UPI0036605B6F
MTEGISGELTARLSEIFSGVSRLGVAFSGGVDSSLLVALAVHTLGRGNVLAVLGVSPSLAASERHAAHGTARQIGVELVEVETREGDSPAYRANGPDRCFHCKDELFAVIERTVAVAYGLDAVAYGENLDDAARHDRPGSLAASRHKVLRPLVDLGLRKGDVRRLARSLGLTAADKPASPCLASRIPHFDEVNALKLGQVERAEAALRSLGFKDSRVRHHGDVARIELNLNDLVRVVSEPLRGQVNDALMAAGFCFVAVDLAGMQSGAFTMSLIGVASEPHA